MEAIAKHCASYVVYAQMWQEGVAEYLAQMGEEAVILISDEWKRGKDNHFIGKFLAILLKLTSLGLSKHMQAHLDQSCQLLKRLQKRIESAATKKVSPVLHHFSQTAQEQQVVLSGRLQEFRD